jgi:aryl-alcohol dehydrogenase-like predicted oxidoreductase
VPVPGTKRRHYLEENAAAVDIVLTTEDVRELSGIFRRTPRLDSAIRKR